MEHQPSLVVPEPCFHPRMKWMYTVTVTVCGMIAKNLAEKQKESLPIPYIFDENPLLTL